MRLLEKFIICNTGLTQNQNLRGHYADPFFPDAAIVNMNFSPAALATSHRPTLPITLSFGAMDQINRQLRSQKWTPRSLRQYFAQSDSIQPSGLSTL